ncbi:MAG: hypothetical protein PHT52_08195, partial [Eubacteriales bacterium]|nr:hypothetical protein [Eubacteriales bacterium]
KIFKNGELLTSISDPLVTAYEDAGAAQPGIYEYKVKVIYKYKGARFESTVSADVTIEIAPPEEDPGDGDPGTGDPGTGDPDPGEGLGLARPRPIQVA